MSPGHPYILNLRVVQQGTRRIYRLHERGVEAVQAYLIQVWGEAVTRSRLTAESTVPPQRADRT
jgi:hypothetical protein